MRPAQDIGALFPLKLLLFCLGSIFYGALTDQVAQASACLTDTNADLLWLHRVFGYPEETPYRSPMVLVTRTRAFKEQRIVIDMMEEIVEVGADAIRPFPPLVEPFAQRKGLWGVLPHNNRMYLLVDFQRMEKY